MKIYTSKKLVKICSIAVVAIIYGAGCANAACRAGLYKTSDPEETGLLIVKDTPYVGNGWNDKIAYIEVEHGKAIVFEHKDYGGAHINFNKTNGSRVPLPPQFATIVSAIKCTD